MPTHPKFAHPIFLSQISAPQPPIWMVLACLAAVNWLPTQVSRALMHWPLFVDWSARHHALYFELFFLLQTGLLIAGAGYLSLRYRKAMWIPFPAGWRPIFVTMLLLLPLLWFHLSKTIAAFAGVSKVLAYGTQAFPSVEFLFHRAWDSLAYGSSPAGIWGSSISSFTAPVLEELVFSGFMLNALSRRYGGWFGLTGTAALFSLVHTIQFGFGMHLLPLLFSGLTYSLVRMASGSLFMAICAHWLINTVIFFPKWYIAYLHSALAS